MYFPSWCSVKYRNLLFAYLTRYSSADRMKYIKNDKYFKSGILYVQNNKPHLSHCVYRNVVVPIDREWSFFNRVSGNHTTWWCIVQWAKLSVWVTIDTVGPNTATTTTITTTTTMTTTRPPQVSEQV